MKTLTNRFVSLMLVFALALSLSIPAFAAEYSGSTELKNEIGTANDIQTAREAYYALSPEAKKIFDTTLADTPDLLKFHKTYVDKDFVAPVQMRPQAAAVVGGGVVADSMTVLMAELSSLSLPSSVLYSLKAMGAGMIAAIADGPLPLGDILLAAATASVVASVALNWEQVSPQWSSIVQAFQKAFADTASNIISAFSQIKNDAKAEVEKNSKNKEKNPTGRTVGDVHRRLKKEGFKKTGQTGSHETWKKGNRTVAVPNHGKESQEIPIGTLRNIWKQAGWI